MDTQEEYPDIKFSIFTTRHLEEIFFKLEKKDIIALGFNIIQIGISPEHFADGLKHREKEVRTELSQTSRYDKERIAILQKELAEIQAQLANRDVALEEYKSKLVQAHQSLEGFKLEIPSEQIEQAQKELAKGETGSAEKTFQKVCSQGKKYAAEACFQLAELAKSRIDYANAYQYYKKAVALDPESALYLNGAGLIALIIARYSEAEPLFQRSLVIWEKALGPDHPNVATILNNLAELYHDQGHYYKAEPFYKRSLDIMEKTLGTDHPDVATVLENYAILLRKTNRSSEADAMEARAKVIRGKQR